MDLLYLGLTESLYTTKTDIAIHDCISKFIREKSGSGDKTERFIFKFIIKFN